MNKDFLVPILRYVISGLVAAAAGWLLQTFGVEVTAEQREYLTGELTTQGALLITILAAAVSRWLKPRLLRRWHPGSKSESELAFKVLEELGHGKVKTEEFRGPSTFGSFVQPRRNTP